MLWENEQSDKVILVTSVFEQKDILDKSINT